LHLCRCWRLSCRRQHHRRIQSRKNYSLTSFLHSSCRSSHSDQGFILSRLAAFLGTGGCDCETRLSSRNAAACSQFTVGSRIRQGIALISRFAFRCNTCPSSWHLITVKMRPNPAWDGSSECLRAHENNRPSSFIGHRRSGIPIAPCCPARSRRSAAPSIRLSGRAEFFRTSRQETPLSGNPAHRQ